MLPGIPIPLIPKAIVAFVFAFAFWSSSSSQSFKQIPAEYEIEHIDLNLNEDQGLMVDMVVDDEGYLWISSSNGLVVYDGQQSILYNAQQQRFPLDADSRLSLSKSGILFANHVEDEMILSIDPKKRRATHNYHTEHLPNAHKSYFDVSEEGKLFSTHFGGEKDSCSLWEIPSSGKPVQIFTFSQEAYGATIVYFIHQGMHWVQTRTGVWRISLNGSISQFYYNEGNRRMFWSIERGKDGIYFIDEATSSLLFWNDTLIKPIVYSSIPAHCYMRTNKFLVDNEHIYFSGAAYIYILDISTRTIQDLTDQFIQLKKSMIQDAFGEDLLIIKKVHGKIYLLGDKNLYQLVPKRPGIGQFNEPIASKSEILSFRGLVEDEHGNVYASYYSNVAVKSGANDIFTQVKTVPSLIMKDFSAYSLEIWKNQLLMHNHIIDLNTGHTKKMCKDVIHNHITHMLSGDSLWMYAWYTNQFYVYDLVRQHLDSITVPGSTNFDQDFPFIISDMVQDHRSDRFWIATQSYGIVLMNKNGQPVRHFPSHLLEADQQRGICDLYLDGDELWFGSLYGIGVLNVCTEEVHMYRNPVINDRGQVRQRTIFSILPDDEGGFYLGSNRGIVYFDRRKKIFYNLPDNHPLSALEFNRSSAFKDSRGRFYMGTTNGLYSFLPEELSFYPASDSLKPIKLIGLAIYNSVIKDYRYMSADLDALSLLKLKKADTNLEFNFSVPEFEKTIYYSYRINGLDDHWSAYSADNTVLVHSLPSGKYELEIRASSNAVDDAGASYRLALVMPEIWYRKAWVIMLLSLGFVGIITLWIRYRYQQKWKQQKELETLRVNISSDLHDDVGSILSGLAMQSQVMSYEMDEQYRKPMLQISEMSRDAMERMRDTVWAIDSRKDKYENLIDRMRDFAEKNLERKNITHEFIVQGVEGKKFISPETRQNIYLIFKEAITNILKHSDATDVKIRFLQDANHLQLIIHDNGSKIEINNSDGLGLSNIIMRGKKINGTVSTGYENGFKMELKVTL